MSDMPTPRPVPESAETPISLYIDIADGQVADIEVVARAAIAFSEAIKELIFIFDPSLEVRVEFASGTPGSLSLNSIIRSLKAKAEQRPILAAAASTVLLWFGNYAFNEVIDEIRGKDELTEQQLDTIATKVATAIEKRAAQPLVQRVYEELESDRAITGVGASTIPGVRPKHIIPRAEFAAKAEMAILPEMVESRRRSRKRRERVVIISPVLLQSPTRRWRFKHAEGEFGAPIKDAAFLNDLITGRVVLPMTGGVELDVLLETEEELQDRVWVPIEYVVWEVYERHFPPVQGNLLAPPPNEDGNR